MSIYINNFILACQNKMTRNSQLPYISMPNMDHLLPSFNKQKIQFVKNKNMQNIKTRQLMKIIQTKKAYYEHKVKQNQLNNQIDSQNEENEIVFPLVVNMRKHIQDKQYKDNDYGRKTKYKLFSLEDSFIANKKVGQQVEQSEHSLIQKINTSIQQTQETKSNSHSRHLRINTQSSAIKKQNNPSLTKKTFNKSLQKTIKQHATIYKPPSLSQNQIKRQLQILCNQIPKKVIHRKQQQLNGIVRFLQSYNAFFSKLDKIVCICLFKICKIIKVEQNDTLFKVNKPMEQFFIILHGRVKLSNPVIKLKRVCHPGQTILQQIIMNQKQKCQSSLHFPLQKGKALSECYLLQITLQNYKKLKQQLTVFGYKIHFNEFQALLKRNYIVKNMLRSQKNKF